MVVDAADNLDAAVNLVAAVDLVDVAAVFMMLLLDGGRESTSFAA